MKEEQNIKIKKCNLIWKMYGPLPTSYQYVKAQTIRRNLYVQEDNE